jgi:hypothetical protein
LPVTDLASVEGLVTEAPGGIDAICSRLEHLVPRLRGRVRPPSRVQCLSTALDPEPSVEVNDGNRDMVASGHAASREHWPTISELRDALA